MAIATPRCTRTTATEFLSNPPKRQVQRRSFADGCPAGMPIPAPSLPTGAGGQFPSIGAFTVPATHGREAAPPAPTPIREGRTRREKCCASSSSIRSGVRPGGQRRVACVAPPQGPYPLARSSRQALVGGINALSHRCERGSGITDARARGRDRRFSPAFCRGAIRRPPCPDRPRSNSQIRASARSRGECGELHSVLRSSGTSPNRTTGSARPDPDRSAPRR